MATDATEAAIAVVARGLLAHAADNLDWEDCPDLGEHDWLRVVQKAQEIAADPSPTDYRIAYDFLAQRASEGMKLRGRSPTELNRTTGVAQVIPTMAVRRQKAEVDHG